MKMIFSIRAYSAETPVEGVSVAKICSQGGNPGYSVTSTGKIYRIFPVGEGKWSDVVLFKNGVTPFNLAILLADMSANKITIDFGTLAEPEASVLFPGAKLRPGAVAGWYRRPVADGDVEYGQLVAGIDGGLFAKKAPGVERHFKVAVAAWKVLHGQAAYIAYHGRFEGDNEAMESFVEAFVRGLETAAKPDSQRVAAYNDGRKRRETVRAVKKAFEEAEAQEGEKMLAYYVVTKIRGRVRAIRVHARGKKAAVELASKLPALKAADSFEVMTEKAFRKWSAERGA